MAEDIVTLPAPPAVPALPAGEGLNPGTLGRLLGALASRAGPLPKYRYPSAGTLYPVQAYVVLSAPLGTLAAGCHYYDPGTHELAFLSDAPLPPPDGTRPALMILLAAQAAAIAPIYGAHAEDFCTLEAGYMSAALRQEAEACGLMPRDTGLPAAGADALRLDATHLPLLCWAFEDSI